MDSVRPVFIFIFFLAISFFACSKKEVVLSVEKQWIKVEIAGEHAPVYSIYGDINHVLIVTLYGKILKTTDAGKTWETKLNVNSDFGKLELRKDTIIAIANGDDYYSLNEGETWQLLGRDLNFENDLKVISSTGIIYKVKENFSGELGLPYNLLESCDHGSTWKDVFPYQHAIYSVYADQYNGLYVGIANTFVWNATLGSFEEHAQNNAAFYYSK